MEGSSFVILPVDKGGFYDCVLKILDDHGLELLSAEKLIAINQGCRYDSIKNWKKQLNEILKKGTKQ